MAFFGRKRQKEDNAAAMNTQPPEDVVAEIPVEQIEEAAIVGPFDVSDVENRGSRLDLGAIWLPATQGVELRMEVDKKTQRVTGVAVAMGGSILQLQAFAAPKSEGIWDEIRPEISQSIQKQGGLVDDVPGALGRELLVRLPVKMPDGKDGVQPARFVGFDGPRWFLRGVFSGRASFDKDAAKDLEEVFRSVVVVRGTEARAPRDLLELTLPGGLRTPQLPEEATKPAQPDLNPLKKGPEITQIG